MEEQRQKSSNPANVTKTVKRVTWSVVTEDVVEPDVVLDSLPSECNVEKKGVEDLEGGVERVQLDQIKLCRSVDSPRPHHSALEIGLLGKEFIKEKHDFWSKVDGDSTTKNNHHFDGKLQTTSSPGTMQEFWSKQNNEKSSDRHRPTLKTLTFSKNLVSSKKNFWTAMSDERSQGAKQHNKKKISPHHAKNASSTVSETTRFWDSAAERSPASVPPRAAQGSGAKINSIAEKHARYQASCQRDELRARQHEQPSAKSVGKSRFSTALTLWQDRDDEAKVDTNKNTKPKENSWTLQRDLPLSLTNVSERAEYFDSIDDDELFKKKLRKKASMGCVQHSLSLLVQ